MKTAFLFDYSIVTMEKDQEVNLLVKLKAPALNREDHKRLNLGLVIDHSGSMIGEKLRETKEALKMLINYLSADDVLSMVLFNNQVDTFIEPTPVINKDILKHRIDGIRASGRTNLSGGWIKGLELVAQNANKDTINRVILLTDGQANEGICDIKKLVAFGKNAKSDHEISTTTIGFGEDFNEDLLSSVALHAEGNFYFIESTDAAPAIFSDELRGLISLMAQNIEVRIATREHVKFLAQWTNYPSEQKGGNILFKLGDVYATEEKSLLVGLFIPGMSKMGATTIADVNIQFAEINEEHITTKSIQQTVNIKVADAQESQNQQPEEEVMLQIGLQLSAKARKDAIKEADSGDFNKAQEILEDTCEKLETLSVAEDPLLQDEIADLKQQQKSLKKQTDYCKTRKIMSESSHQLSTTRIIDLQRSRKRRRKDGADGENK